MTPISHVTMTLTPHEVQDVIEALGVAMCHEQYELVVRDFRSVRKSVQAARDRRCAARGNRSEAGANETMKRRIDLIDRARCPKCRHGMSMHVDGRCVVCDQPAGSVPLGPCVRETRSPKTGESPSVS